MLEKNANLELRQTKTTSYLNSFVRTEEKGGLRGVGDDGINDRARRDVASPPHGVSGVGGKHPGLVPLLGDQERESRLVASLELRAGATHGR